MAADTAYRILILGGYGEFGSRIARTLAGDAGCHVILAGRHPERGAALLASIKASGAGASLASTMLDSESPHLAQQIGRQRADLVIHAAGPFLDRSYKVARACIEAGASYIDLADNREFVLGIGTLHEAALDKGVLVVSGASTVPALSAAIVDHHRGRFLRIDAIDIGITPGSRAPRGRSTIESVLNCCGKPFTGWQCGSWKRIYGWQDLHRVRYPSLGVRWFANCDIPDLALFPVRYGVTGSVKFSAALELRSMQFSVWFMSWLTRLGLVSSWVPAVPLLKSASDLLMGLGLDQGGMHVQIDGLDDGGRRQRLRWFLTARSGHGPIIPCVASIVLARKLARGELRRRGATSCVDMVTLEEFQSAVSHLDISYEQEISTCEPDILVAR